MEITSQEAWTERESGVSVAVPYFAKEILEHVIFEARDSEFVDQKSGVSARMTITAMELLQSAAERRALINGEKTAIVRVADMFHIVPAITGKLELVYEGEQEGAANVAKVLIGKAINKVFKNYFPDPQKKDTAGSTYENITGWFTKGNVIDLPDTLSNNDYEKALTAVDGLKDLAAKHMRGQEKDEVLIAMDFILEGLHQNSLLGKDDLDDSRSYSDMVGSMLGSLGDLDDEDFRDEF